MSANIDVVLELIRKSLLAAPEGTLGGGALTPQTVHAAIMKSHGAGNVEIPAEVLKSWTQSGSPTTGLTAYDLEGPAKLLYPILTPLRNSTPRVGGGVGTATNWKAITGVNVTNIEPGIGEGQRGAIIAHTLIDKLAAYRGLGLEDDVTFEADMAARTYDDAKARAVESLLNSFMIAEERTILGGNTSDALGTTPTPTLATSTTGGTLPDAAAFAVICVALTPAGLRASSVSASGVPGLVTRTNADGSVITYGGGSAQESAAATIATTGGGTSSVTATVAAVSGAYAYAWFWGTTAGAARIGAITTINSVAITANTAAPNQLATAIPGPGADHSTNAYVYDGYLTFIPGAGYAKVQATGTAGVGTPLTAGTDGSIVEFDEALQWFWDNYKLSPDEIWVSSQEARTIRAKILAAGTNAAQRFVFDVSQNKLTGGTVAMSYLNPFGVSGGGEYGQGKEIPIKIHPDMPAGTVFFRTKTLPYKLSNVTNVAQIKLRRDYYQLEWPLRTRKYEYGVYCDGVLQNYFPPAFGSITNIGKG